MPIFDVPLDDLRRRTSIKWRRFEPDVLPMFVAEMDARIAEPVRERLERALRDGDTGYPQEPIYQEAFADFAAWRWGWQVSADQIQLATDVVTGMRETLTAASAPGEAIAYSSPIYPPFRVVIASAGRRGIDIPLAGDRLDLPELERAFAEQRPKAYLLCSPHNPNGTVHTRAELEQLAQIAAEHDVLVISNEIHAPLSASHVPFLNVAGSEGGLVITSASKCWNLAGMKAALIAGNPELRQRLSPVLAEGASHFGVIAHATALSQARDWLLEVADEVAHNKALLSQLLAPRLSYTPSPGTYLAWVDCAPLGLEDPAEVFHRIGRVRFNPGADYAPYAKQHIRINLATSPELIVEGVQRMYSALG